MHIAIAGNIGSGKTTLTQLLAKHYKWDQLQEAVHNNLLRAQNIISELQRCLNLRGGGDFAINMFRLYDFMNTRLMEANARKEPENIRIVLRLLGENLFAKGLEHDFEQVVEA